MWIYCVDFTMLYLYAVFHLLAVAWKNGFIIIIILNMEYTI